MYYILCNLCQRKVISKCKNTGYSKYVYSTSTYICHTWWQTACNAIEKPEKKFVIVLNSY